MDPADFFTFRRASPRCTDGKNLSREGAPRNALVAAGGLSRTLRGPALLKGDFPGLPARAGVLARHPGPQLAIYGAKNYLNPN